MALVAVAAGNHESMAVAMSRLVVVSALLGGGAALLQVPALKTRRAVSTLAGRAGVAPRAQASDIAPAAEAVAARKAVKGRLNIRIDDTWYDLTNWRAAHPAGTHWIDAYNNSDATEVMYGFHSEKARRGPRPHAGAVRTSLCWLRRSDPYCTHGLVPRPSLPHSTPSRPPGRLDVQAATKVVGGARRRIAADGGYLRVPSAAAGLAL